MSNVDHAKADTQNIEGKGQELTGAVTGNSQDEAAGKAKQVAAKVRDGIEDTKDAMGNKAKQAAEKLRSGFEDVKEKLNK